MKAYTLVGDNTVQGSPVQGILPIDVREEGDLRLYKITLPFLPPSKNEYDPWPGTWKSAAKKKWMRHIETHVKALGIPAAEKIGLAAVLVFPTKAARRDPQNYSNCLWHWVPDALQAAGVIDDDRAGKIELGPNWGINFAVDDRAAPKEKRKRTIIMLTMRVKGSK
jgi:hypothetical protein